MEATTFLESFQCLYNSSNLSDVTIVLPGQNLEDRGPKIFAHRIVLAAGSHGFRDYFADNPIEVKLTACCFPRTKPPRLAENGKLTIYRRTAASTISTTKPKFLPTKSKSRDIYDLDSADHYLPMLRYLYGLPLCAEGEYLSALSLRSMCDAASGFGIPNLRQHALYKLQELLSSHLQVDGIKPPDGQPLPIGYQDASIGPFLFEVDSLLTADEEDSFDDDTYSKAMQVAVKVCCEHLEIPASILRSSGSSRSSMIVVPSKL